MRCTGSWLRILCAIAAGPGCTGTAGAPSPHPRVALLTLDTWRLDHFDAQHSPRLWALSQQGERFDNAWTPIGLTSPAHATMFTGLMPWQHGMEGNNHHGYSLPPAVETVSEQRPATAPAPLSAPTLQAQKAA
jgi:arylsulfatase A-like enzyme